MISVVIPLYNKEDYIRQTIRSVLDQTFTDYEIVVIDDGSKDNSLKIVHGVNDSRIKVFQKENGGVSSARNYGITKAKYKYVAFLDADDFWGQDYLMSMVQLIQDFPKAEVYASNFFRIYDGNHEVVASNNIERGYIKNYFKTALNETVIHTSSVIVTKTAFDKAGIFDERISRGEDMDLWTRLGVNCLIAYNPRPYNKYYLGTINSSANFIPHPENIFAFYIKLDNCINYYHFKYLKRLLIRRTFRYLFIDFKFNFFLKMIKTKKRELLKLYSFL